jgi:hypothetical protein
MQFYSMNAGALLFANLLAGMVYFFSNYGTRTMGSFYPSLSQPVVCS